MRLTPLFCVVSGLAAFSTCSGGETPKAPLLKLDFGAKASPVQSGCVGVTAALGQVKGPLMYEFEGYDRQTTSAGVITLTIAGGAAPDATGSLCARDRGALPFNKPSGSDDLYRDFIAGPSVMTVGISGLKPNGSYDVVFYAFDKVRAQTIRIENFTGNFHDPNDATIFYDAKTSAADADAGTLSATLRAKAPASGTILFRITCVGGGSAVLNAIALTPIKATTP